MALFRSLPISRPTFFIALASITISLFLGYLNFERPVNGFLLLQCQSGAKVEVEVEYGRFSKNSARLILSPMFSSDVNSRKLLGLFEGNYPPLKLVDHDFFIQALEVTKSSTIKALTAKCVGLTKAIITDLDYSTLQVLPVADGRSQFEWPRESILKIEWRFWFAGWALFSLILWFLFFEVRVYQRFQSKADKALPVLMFLALGSLYFYYFPGFIGPYNPANVLMVLSQHRAVSGWEGILYSLLFDTIIEFVPKIQYAVLIQNLILFLGFSRFVLIGKSTQQRYLFLFGVIGLSFLSSWTNFYTQYLERGVFTGYCLLLYLLSLYSFLKSDRFYFENSKLRSGLLILCSLILVMLRNEYLVILLPVLLFCFQAPLKRISMALMFILSSVFLTQQLDRLEVRKADWRFKYYVVSLSGYFFNLSQTNQLSTEENHILSRYFNLDALKIDGNYQSAMKNYEAGNDRDFFELAKIILKHFKQHPFAMITNRLQYALTSVGASPYPIWLYTPASRKFIDDDKYAISAETLGIIKMPGDPFYSKFSDIYKDQEQKTPFAFSYGIIFILMGLFLFRFFPVTSLICWTLFAKLLVIALLAPTCSMHYVIDVYWFCALIPVLAWAEYKDRRLKKLSSSP